MVFLVTFWTCSVRSCRLTSSSVHPRRSSGLSWTRARTRQSSIPIDIPSYASFQRRDLQLVVFQKWSDHRRRNGPSTSSCVERTTDEVDGPLRRALNGGIGADRMTLRLRHGPHLPGLSRDDALRPPGGRGHDAVF